MVRAAPTLSVLWAAREACAQDLTLSPKENHGRTELDVGEPVAFVCAVKSVALERAKTLLDGRHADRVAEALHVDACADGGECVITADLGCFNDRKRILPTPVADGAATMNRTTCARLGSLHGFGPAAYCGVEDGNQCWCADTLPGDAEKIDESECAMPCVGTPTETCGDAYKIGVFQADCSSGPPPVAPRDRPLSKKQADGFVLYVSPSGNDSAAGTASAPLRSLHTAQAHLRQLTPAQRAGAMVSMAPGTYYLPSSLVFTHKDSGMPGQPVTWAAPDGKAVISGGTSLPCQGRWQMVQSQPTPIYACAFGSEVASDVSTSCGADQQGVENSGDNLKSVSNPDLDTNVCCAACDELDACVGWTLNLAQKKCWLKGSVSPRPRSGVISGVKADRPSRIEFESLFVSGERQVRARYPNGSPYKPKDGYSGGCQASDDPSKKWPTKQVQVLRNNLNVHGKDGETLVSRLIVFPQDKDFNITVLDTEKPRTVDMGHENGQKVFMHTRFNESYNLPYWNSTSPSEIVLPPSWKDWGKRHVSSAGAVVKMLHPAAWGSWAFEVEEYDAGSNSFLFSRGGHQEAEGTFGGCGDMYVENLREELDAPNEWWLDAENSTLFFALPSGWTEAQLQAAPIEAPLMQRVIQVRGSAAEPAHDLSFEGFNLTHAAPTYLESYEATSGGDWSVHRGGAVFLDGAERVVFRSISFDQLDGNGVFFSNHVRDSTVEHCDFWRTGDSAMLAVGSAPGGDARVASGAMMPLNNSFNFNWIEEVGVHIKQTSCFFKSMSQSTVRGNVCYNGPRAGVNWNDGMPGGDIVEGNIIFNMVRETGDHGTFNSWDRKEYIYDCPNGGTCFTPQTMHVRHNMFIGPAGYNMDHDDGSSQYDDYSNVVYLGGFKYRDGVMRNMTKNLMINALPAFQVIGFETDFFVDNTIVSSAQAAICGPANIGGLSGQTYAVLESPSPPPPAPPPSCRGPGWHFPDCICDSGHNVTISEDQLKQMLRDTTEFEFNSPLPSTQQQFFV